MASEGAGEWSQVWVFASKRMRAARSSWPRRTGQRRRTSSRGWTTRTDRSAASLTDPRTLATCSGRGQSPPSRPRIVLQPRPHPFPPELPPRPDPSWHRPLSDPLRCSALDRLPPCSAPDLLCLPLDPDRPSPPLASDRPLLPLARSLALDPGRPPSGGAPPPVASLPSPNLPTARPPSRDLVPPALVLLQALAPLRPLFPLESLPGMRPKLVFRAAFPSANSQLRRLRPRVRLSVVMMRPR